ncbi:MAG TPA: DNA topoisomerase, partial [Burkholderiales bacterium]
AARAGDYEGRWFDEGFDKARKEFDADARPERLWEAARAEAIRAKCLGKRGSVEEESKPTTQLSPLLYDLTSLQRDANGRFGFSARTTLQLAQALYEKHKALTYPRTDSRALPEDYPETVKATLKSLADPRYQPFAAEVLKQKWVRPNKRVFNNAKISDHFAIIPTGFVPKHLSETEQKLYDLVTKRFLAVFYPAAEFLVTTRITRVEGEAFKTEGKVMVNAGWLAVYGKEAEEDGTPSLVPVKPAEQVAAKDVEVVANQTKPPPRFTEATLLSAMEGAGKLVEDEELRAAMEQKGLGTPATRAQVIEGLIDEEYVHRSGRELQPTPKAFSLLFALRHFGVDELTSPELTGDWEYKLKEMELGRLPRQDFMDHITSMTRDMVERIKTREIPDTAFATVEAPCPHCGGIVQENYRRFQCLSCDFSLWKVLSGREWAPEEVAQLIRDRQLGPLSGFRSRMGRPFSALIKLGAENKVEFDFGNAPGEGAEGEAPDFSGQTPLGPCPKCGANVYEQPMAYVCEKAVGPERSCDFRSGRVILQRPIEREQMVRLLATGRTDLLKRFISKKGRPFSAFLVRGDDGKVGFEFAPREAKTSKGTATKKTSSRKKASA